MERSLPCGVGAAMKLTHAILIAEEHRLQNAPALIQRTAATGIMVGMADDIEFLATRPWPRGMLRRPIRSLALRQSRLPRGASTRAISCQTIGFIGETEMLEHMLRQHFVDRTRRDMAARPDRCR